jgi:hypothetical protein
VSATRYQDSAFQDDPIAAAIGKLIAAAVILAIATIALPLVIPVLAVLLGGEAVAVRAQFWVTWKWHPLLNAIGVTVVVGLLVTEGMLLTGWLHGQRHTALDHDNAVHVLFELLGPWLLVNLLSGILLLPAAWSIHRRRIASRVRSRRISDVMRQTRIESARKRAADANIARRIGVNVHPTSGKITGANSGVTTAPLHTAEGEAFALLSKATVVTMAERFYEARRLRDWLDRAERLLLLPRTASAVRALVVAESGSGKTVLLGGLVLCALRYGWPVFFLDAKGDPQDAEALGALALAEGRSVAIGGAWDLFTGTADQVTGKLMRLMPSPDGANQYYLDEIRGVLQAVQDHEPLHSAADLRARLTRPADWVRDQFDLQMVNAVVDRNGTTAGTRALQTLLVALRPLERFIEQEGWSYGAPTADLTIVPLSPVDDAQARLGDLLLLDLRNFLATRLAARDKSPMLVIVDEFPQLITGTSDPGDTAGSLFETARSAGVGLVLATQSPAGLSNDDIRRRRAITSGAALIFGRSKDPEEIVHYAGTVMQMEASGSAAGEELRSARAQHTYVVPPQDVREAADGAFWIVQGGAIAPFRALPLKTLVADASS